MLLLGFFSCLSLASPAPEPAKLLVSAGPGCHPRNAGSCSLYLLELGEKSSARLIREASDGTGAIEAMASPNGQRVVYLERKGSKSERLVVQDLASGERRVVVERGEGPGPQWPTWLDDEVVLYNQHFNRQRHPQDQDPSLFTVPASGGPPQLLFGTGRGGRDCYSDPDVHQGQIVAQHTAPGATPVLPAVLGHEIQDLSGLEECHHPAWRPDGQAVACFGHAAIEMLPLPRGGAARVRPLYLQTLSGQTSLLFPIPSPEQLHKELGILLKPRDLIAFKYPDWVDEDRVVMTVYVSRDQDIVSSQAVMITLSSGRLTDLTPMLGQGLSAFTVSAL